MKHINFLAVFLYFLLVPSSKSAEWFVATNGTFGGAGTLGSPIDLTKGLTNSSPASSGDTVFLLPGIYKSDNWLLDKSGSSTNSPIIFRNYLGGRAIIDGVLSLGTRTNVTFWGLEFIDTGKSNRASIFDSISGTANYGVKFINTIHHDVCIALAGGPYESLGALIWHAGKNANEHSWYWQNPGIFPKKFHQNISLYAGGFGIHSYSASGALGNYEAYENVIAGSGIPNNDPKANILFGGGSPAWNIFIRGNHLWNTSGGYRGIGLGQDVAANTNAVVLYNKVYDVSGIWAQRQFASLIIKSNTLIAYDNFGLWFDDPDPVGPGNSPFDGAGPYDINYNTYFSSEVHNNFRTNSSFELSFAQWKAGTPFDVNSTYTEVAGTTSLPNSIHVMTNLWEPRTNTWLSRRGHVVAWNFTNASTVTVDVSGLLSSGDIYSVLDANNYFGTPVATGIYSGGDLTLSTTNRVREPWLYHTPTLAQSSWPDVRTNMFVYVVMGAFTNSSSGGGGGSPSLPLFPNLGNIPGEYDADCIPAYLPN